MVFTEEGKQMGSIKNLLGKLKAKSEEVEYHEHDAIQYSDEMYCKRCKKRWDTNDPDEPKCLSK